MKQNVLINKTELGKVTGRPGYPDAAIRQILVFCRFELRKPVIGCYSIMLQACPIAYASEEYAVATSLNSSSCAVHCRSREPHSTAIHQMQYTGLQCLEMQKGLEQVGLFSSQQLTACVVQQTQQYKLDRV